MNFQQFAEQHGLIIENLITDQWVRCRTTDKPNKKNGSYIYNGSNGAVQNWALHVTPIVWRGNGRHDPHLPTRIKKAQDDQKSKQDKAASKAAWILNNTRKDTHSYLIKKGFPEELALCWKQFFVIPMRVDGNLVGCQLIDPEGNKKFLYGQRTKGATACFDNKGKIILCEGYATALSIRRFLKAQKQRYTIHVCFSAGNMLEVSKRFPDCVIVADNDPVGIRVAKKSGKPYWISPVSGEDFNDYELRVNPSANDSLLKLL
jgi:putative DNA primase/helicase